METIDWYKGLVLQGWQCPTCKRVYSPTTTMCLYCGDKTIAGTTTQPCEMENPYVISNKEMDNVHK